MATVGLAVQVELVSAPSGAAKVDFDAGGQIKPVINFLDSPVVDDGRVVFVTWQDLGAGDAPPFGGFPDGDLAIALNGVVQAFYVLPEVSGFLWSPIGDGSHRVLAATDDGGSSYFYGRIGTSGAEYLVSGGQATKFDEAEERYLYGVGLAGNGLVAVFCSDTNLGQADLRRAIFRRDLQSGVATCITARTSSACVQPAIDGSGERIVFASMATDLAGGTPGVSGIFMYHASSDSFSRLSLANPLSQQGAWRPMIAANGSAVAFETSEGAYWGAPGETASQVVLWRQGGDYLLCSLGDDGLPGNGPSEEADIDADGRFVVYATTATNIVGAADGKSQIAIFDTRKRRAWPISRESLTPARELANAACGRPNISPNGRYVTFASAATNLSPRGDSNFSQVYRVDLGPLVEDAVATLPAGETVDLNFEISRSLGPRRILATSLPAIGVLRTRSGSTVVVGERHGLDSLPWRYTAGATPGTQSFEIQAEDDQTTSLPARVTLQVFTAGTGILERVSVTSAGNGINLSPDSNDQVLDLLYASTTIDATGSVVCFATRAPLSPADMEAFLRYDVYTRHRHEGTTRFHSAAVGENKHAGQPKLAAGGTYLFHLATASDGNSLSLLRTNLATAAVDMVATFAGSDPFDPERPGYAVSGDGRRVCYSHASTGELLLWQEGVAEAIPLGVSSAGLVANAACSSPTMSADGRVVAFVSKATNLAAGNEDDHAALFVRFLDADPSTGVTVLAWVTTEPDPVTTYLSNASLSRQGRYVSFIDGQPGMVYVQDLFAGTTPAPSPAVPGSIGASHQGLSADGRFVAFSRSDGTVIQVYRYDRLSGVVEPLALVSNDGMGGGGNANSGAPAISATGQFVAFPSLANNLIQAGLDSGVDLDVFVNDFGVPANQLPVPMLVSLLEAEEDALLDIELTYADAEGNDVAVELVDQPAHALFPLVVVPPGPGQPFPRVAYQAKANYFGPDSFSYRVGDAHGWSAPQVVNIAIAEVNDPPVWTDVPTFDEPPLAEGATRQLDLRDFVDDPDLENPPPHVETLTFAIVAATAVDGRDAADWITIVDGHRLVVSPPYDIATFANPLVEFDVSLEVSDREETVPLGTPMRLVVQNTDRPPVIESVVVYPAAPRTTDNLVAVAVASDPDQGDAEEVAVEYQWHWNGQPHAALTDAILPAAETLKGEVWSVAVRAVSRGLFSEWAVSAPRSVVNTPPVVTQAGAATGGENEAIVVDLSLLAADPDLDDGVDEYGFEILDAPAQGSYTLVGSQLTYRPAWDELAAGEQRQVDFRYRVSDGMASDEGMVAITVVGENDAPVVQVIQHLRLPPGERDGQVSTAYGQASGQAPASAFGPGAVTVWDVDSPAAQVRLRVASLPGKGSLLIDDTELTVGHEFEPGESLLYRANSAVETGTDSFALAGWDGSAQTTPAMPVTIFLGRFETTITLFNGWNAIALPLQPDELDLATLLRNPQTGMPAFVGNAWQYRSAGGFYFPVQQATAGEGVIVFCEGLPPEGLPIDVSGTAVEAAVELEAGWHLRGGLGYGASAPLPATVENAPYGRGWVYQVAPDGTLSLPASLVSGRAMWFRVDIPGSVQFTLDPPPVN